MLLNGFTFLVSLISIILSLTLLLLSTSTTAINSLHLAPSETNQNNAALAEISSLLSQSPRQQARDPDLDDPFQQNKQHHRFHTAKSPEPTNPSTQQTPSIATKFVLLTTGDQIKLYPFLSAANELSSSNTNDKLSSSAQLADQLSSEFHYVVKPFQLNTTDQSKLNQFGNSTYINWLQEQANANAKLYNNQQQQNLLANSTIKQTREQPTTRASILPRNADNEDGISDDGAFQGESGWKKPLILDVDYFIDERFCGINNYNEDDDSDNDDSNINNNNNNNNEDDLSPYSEPKNDEIPVEIRERQSICLVIVWLDANNHFIHFGSIDLAKNPLYQELNKQFIDKDNSNYNYTSNITYNNNSSSSSIDNNIKNNESNNRFDLNQQNQVSSHGQKSALLQLDEFPPIDIYKSLEIISDFESIIDENETKKTYGLTIDHKTNALHVAFSDGSGYPNRILSGRLNPIMDVSEPDFQLVGETIHSFNDCPNLATANQELSNLIVDEQSGGDRLYYFDKTSLIIYALKLNKKNFIDSDETGGFAHATQALVRNIPSDSAHYESSNHHQKEVLIKPTSNSYHDTKWMAGYKPLGVALNNQNNRLYWLSSSNQVYSCDRAGRDVKVDSQLTMRPAIRAPIRLEIFDDRLYIVDSFKWSLIEHDLIDDLSLAGSSKPSHRVILIERFALLGARFVNLLDPVFQKDNKISDVSEDKIDPFESLLETSPTCVPKEELQTTYFSDNYKYYLMELMLLYIVFIIWLSLPWVKRKLKK